MLHPQIFSRIGTQTTRFMKVFSLESFPLYGRPSMCLKGNKPCYHGDGYSAIVNIEFVGYVIVVPWLLNGRAIVPSEGY